MKIQTPIKIFVLSIAASLALTTGTHAAVPGVVSGQGTWESTLLGRDVNLNAVAATDATAVYLYDANLNVTWLRNANVNGAMSWAAANAWAENLVTGSGAAAISDWRLPTTTPTTPAFTMNDYDGLSSGGFNVPTSSSEMANLFFSTLGDKSSMDTKGNALDAAYYGLTNTGSFKNLLSQNYWSGTPFGNSATVANAWFFGMDYGYQNTATVMDNNLVVNRLYALAVRSGDVAVSSVPEPETYALMLAGLGLLAAFSRSRQAKSTL
jgi:hypothetical protein